MGPCRMGFRSNDPSVWDDVRKPFQILVKALPDTDPELDIFKRAGCPAPGWSVMPSRWSTLPHKLPTVR